MGHGKASWWLLAAAWTAGCAGGSATTTVTLSAAQEHLPCAGMQRLRLSVFQDESHGQGLDLLHRFYDDQGGCAFPAGWQVELDHLPFSENMWLLAEGFDSTNNRRLTVARSAAFGRSQVEQGNLPGLVLERESRNNNYALISLVLEIPDLEQIGPGDSLEYNINFSNPNSPNASHGSFFRDSAGALAGPPLVLSGLVPENANRLLVVARRGAQTVSSWRAEYFDIGAEALFVNVVLEKY